MKSVRYYTLSGVELGKADAKGLVIVRTRCANGRQSSRKVMTR